VGDRTSDPVRTRYGCFLPDLTGLARDPSTGRPPAPTIPAWDGFWTSLCV